MHGYRVFLTFVVFQGLRFLPIGPFEPGQLVFGMFIVHLASVDRSERRTSLESFIFSFKPCRILPCSSLSLTSSLTMTSFNTPTKASFAWISRFEYSLTSSHARLVVGCSSRWNTLVSGWLRPHSLVVQGINSFRTRGEASKAGYVFFL